MSNITKILIVILVIAGGAYWWQQKPKTENIEPSITLLSPNGGELLKIGSTFTIRWLTKNIPASNKVAVSIRRVAPPPLSTEGQEFDPIIFVNLENTGSQDWIVSDMYPEGNYIIGVNSYASLPITNPISDESDATFQIVK